VIVVGWLLSREAGVCTEQAGILIRDGAVLLGVPEASAWQARHAPVACPLPLGELGGRLDGLPRERRVAVLGHLDNRSGKTLSLLGGIGFDAVSLNGQMQAWATMGLIVKADGIAQGAVA
jgi:rhodanese-related sulfurtransferase